LILTVWPTIFGFDVKMRDSTSGATIYYTTDGSTPTTSSAVYSGPITVGSTETLRAIAAASGYSQSAIGTATYAIATTTTPTLSVSTSGTPSIYGGIVVFTATISTGPSGSITFYDGGVSIGSGAISGSTAIYTTSTLGVGTHAITASYAGAPGYNPVTSGAITQIVNQASQTITFGTLSGVTYGTGPIALGATASSGLPVSYTVTGPATVSGATLTVTGSGTVTVTASQAGNSNYAAATSVQRTFTVAKAVLTVAANNATRIYGASNPTFTYTIAGYVNGDSSSVVSGTATMTTTATTSSSAGTYPITFATQPLAAMNYTFNYVSGTLTVTGGAAQTITFTAPTSPVVFGVSPSALSATASSGLAVTFSVLSGPGTISGNMLTVTGAGTIVIAANQTGSSNYAAAPQVTQSVVVNQATQTISFTAPTSPVTYGVSPITLSASASTGLAVTFSIVSGPGAISDNTLTITGAGTVVLAANQAGNSNFLAAPQVTQSVVVNQATQTINFTNPTSPVIYGASPIALSATGGASGNSVVFSVLSGPGTVSGNILTITGVGTVVAAANQLGNTNYAAAPQVTQSVVVTQATQTINFPALTSPVTYGASPITLSATGGASGNTVVFSVASGPGTISGNTLMITGAGTVVAAANQAGTSNYAAAPQVTQTVVVNHNGEQPNLSNASSAYRG
jgi:hypothetical protein